jgi:hypothetical protein
METSGVSLLYKGFSRPSVHSAVGLAGGQPDRFQIGTAFCGFGTLVSALRIVAGKLQK